MGYAVKKQSDLYVPLKKPLSAEDKKRKHQTENGHASSIQKRFLESWTITVPSMRRSWSYTFLSSRKGTSLLAELINYFWIAPNLSHHSYQAAPNPSQVTTEMWNSDTSLLGEPRRQKGRNDRLHFPSARISWHASIDDYSDMRSSNNTSSVKMDQGNYTWLPFEEVVILQGAGGGHTKPTNKRKHKNNNKNSVYWHYPESPWGVKTTFINTDCSVFSALSL